MSKFKAKLNFDKLKGIINRDCIKYSSDLSVSTAIPLIKDHGKEMIVKNDASRKYKYVQNDEYFYHEQEIEILEKI